MPGKSKRRSAKRVTASQKRTFLNSRIAQTALAVVIISMTYMLFISPRLTSKTADLSQNPPPEDPTNVVHYPRTYVGVLPCADCPGLKTKIALQSDGTYTMSETYLERGGLTITSGTWKAQNLDGRIIYQLKNTKTREVTNYAQSKPTQIILLGSDMNPISSPYNTLNLGQ